MRPINSLPAQTHSGVSTEKRIPGQIWLVEKSKIDGNIKVLSSVDTALEMLTSAAKTRPDLQFDPAGGPSSWSAGCNQAEFRR